MFAKKNWKNRLVEYPGRRKLTDILTGKETVVDVARHEGEISNEGDPFSAANMNDLENRLSDKSSDVNFLPNGNVQEVFADGSGKILTEFLSNGNVVSTLYDKNGNAVEVKTTEFLSNGSVRTTVQYT